MDKRILVVEDEALIALDIEMTLLDLGYSDVSICASRNAALDSISRNLPAAAFLDFNLGNDTTSTDVATALQERGIPFCFISGYTDVTVPLPDALKNVPRLTKPINQGELLALLGKMVG